MRKAFTLMEIVIVVFLMGSVTLLLFSNFNLPEERKISVSLENIKEYMLSSFSYEEELSLICVEDEKFSCYIFVDNQRQENIEVNSLFKELPSVYNYDKQLSSLEFKTIKIDDYDENIFFELKIDNDRKHKGIVVDTNDENVYVFNPLSNTTQKYENTNEVVDLFYERETEVRDAL